jgi:hypothetical protein
MQYQPSPRTSPLSSLPTTTTGGPSKTFHLTSSQVKNKNEPALVVRLDKKGNLSSPSAAPASAIHANIQMFGGRQTLIQRQTNKLQTKWEKDSKPLPCTKKVIWYTSPKSGRFKKRVALV